MRARIEQNFLHRFQTGIGIQAMASTIEINQTSGVWEFSKIGASSFWKNY